MPAHVLLEEDTYVLNHCTRHLARDNTDGRHAFYDTATGFRANVCESWRFPVIDSYYDAALGPDARYAFNEVTFVYFDPTAPAPQSVSVVGTFAPLYERLPMRRIEGTRYFTVSLRVPKGEVYVYKYLVDGQWVLDPINPQETRLDNGERWSRFFTHQCLVPLTFESWEQELLRRLTDHLLPFRTRATRDFIERYLKDMDSATREARFPNAHRLDQSVGVVNFIDKLLAREERHNRDDYKTCIALIADILRQRYPHLPPDQVPRETIVALYDELAGNGSVAGWDYTRYGEPAYFLKLLRRHTLMGAFSHPKYGGNVGAVGWAFLEDSVRHPATGQTLFDWRRSIEQPLGRSEEYRG
ncbi:gluconate 2-dehydrogenase subunit 3 family protein [Archangium sp.]|uniref:gluconate 2-dehydrogenase subunit 3 family protein n=1 Tax=Archangium sp. TaxID=1872627 RepID=UPI002D2790D1|nr:gluconate 2-dehydrogenase subunit 3 family protein [Archangium sp.]HYO55756.1 gluconate 2-dehydrogenase subunit 3 family protein [Archangium sp.]